MLTLKVNKSGVLLCVNNWLKVEEREKNCVSVETNEYTTDVHSFSNAPLGLRLWRQKERCVTLLHFLVQQTSRVTCVAAYSKREYITPSIQVYTE